jgi:ribosomal protein S18 acetylase RimI-like enzyme
MQMDGTIRTIQCDYNNAGHCKAQIDLMRLYMTDKMGGAAPLSDEQNQLLIEGLKNHPTTYTLLAIYKGEYVGLTNSFINFGTFMAKKFLNIHDVVVDPQYRGLGIGKILMEANIQGAKEMGCGKVTLEVREDNRVAQNLYRQLGFGECHPNMYFWAKYL